MQGEVGQALYRKFGIDPERPDTLIVVTTEVALRDSDAVIAIWSRLAWPWRALVAVRVIPRGVRDPLYRTIARYRYALFGKRQTCWLPNPEDRDRVL